MAVGQTMIQVERSYMVSHEVRSSTPPVLYGVVDLDGDQTVVREIAAQRIGAVVVTNRDWHFSLDVTEQPLATLELYGAGGQEPIRLQAPSHVPSPEFKGVREAWLVVRVVGIGFTEDGDEWSRTMGHRIPAHAYLDENA